MFAATFDSTTSTLMPSESRGFTLFGEPGGGPPTYLRELAMACRRGERLVGMKGTGSVKNACLLAKKCQRRNDLNDWLVLLSAGYGMLVSGLKEGGKQRSNRSVQKKQPP